MSGAARVTVQEFSLRIKYESFSKLTTELNNVQTFQGVASVLHRNLKYIFNFSTYRIRFFYESEQVVFEINRQGVMVKQEHEPLAVVEEEVLASNITALFDETQLMQRAVDVHPFFYDQAKNLCIYPSISGKQMLLICAGHNENIPPLDADYRFLRFTSEFLMNKLTQIILTVQLEKLVSKRTTQLDAANRELSTLFYNASHGMTAPLTTLLGLFGLGRLYAGTDENLALVFDKAGDVATDAQHMFYKFRFISELENACKLTGELDLASMLSNIEARHSSAAQRKKLKLITQLNRSCPIIAFNEHILQTLINNLVENAIQFHHRAEDGFVKVKVTSLSDRLIVIVEDNGRGISKEHLAGIFDMYARYHESSKGVGIGLYLVKKTVEKLNGTISLQTEVNRGSTFEIKIPL